MTGPHYFHQLVASLVCLAFLPFCQPNAIPHLGQCECDSLPAVEQDSCLETCMPNIRQPEQKSNIREQLTLNELSSWEMSIVSCCALNVHEHCCHTVRHLGLQLASLQFALHELDGVNNPSAEGHKEHKRERERKGSVEQAPEVNSQVHDADPDLIGFFGEKRSGGSDMEPGFFDEEKRSAIGKDSGVGPGFFDEDKRSATGADVSPGFFSDEKRGSSYSDMEPGFFDEDKRSATGADVGPGFFAEEKRGGSYSDMEPGFFDEDKRDGRRRRNGLDVGFFPDDIRKRLAADRTFQSEPGFFGDMNEEKRKAHHHGSKSHHKRYHNTVIRIL